MNLSSICRLCFSTNSLHPIFMDNNLHEKYSTAVFNATGVEIQINDGLPQQVCIKCLTLINTALKFRKRCKLVEKELLRMKSVYNVTDKHDGNISSTKALIQKAHLTIEFEPVVRIKTEEIDDLTESIEVGTSQRQTFQNEAINTEIDYSIITSVTSHNQIKPSNIDENLNLESTVDKKNCGGMLRVTKIKSEDTDVNKGQLLDYKQIIEACENDFSDNDVNHRNEIKIYFSDNEKSQNMDTKIYLSDNEMSHNSNININLSDNDTQMNDTEITKLPLKTSGRHKKTRRIKTTNSNNKGTMKIKQAENGINTVELPYNCLPILNGSKKRVTCKMCAKNLSIRSIDTHMAKIHPGADERKVKCDLCDTFVLKCKLKFHTKLIHGSGAFKCIHCKSEFQSRTVLVEHIQTCSINKRRRKSYKAVCVKSETKETRKRLKRKLISLEDKIEILNRLKAGEKVSSVAKSINLNESTIRTVNKNAEKIRKTVADGCPFGAKRINRVRNINMVKMEQALMIWLEDCIAKKIPMSGNLIKQKALKIFEHLKNSEHSSVELKDYSFSASKGWFEKFKKRYSLHNIKFKGEHASADADAVENYKLELARIIDE